LKSAPEVAASDMEGSLERIELKWQGRVYRKEIRF
jgi:hypothetical protein